MNKILLLSVLLLSSLSAQADNAKPNPLLSFLASIPGAKQYAVYSLITNRCDRYLDVRAEEKKCHAAVEKKIQILNFDALEGENGERIRYNPNEPHSFIIVAFKKNLIALLNEARTADYLNMLQEEFSRDESPNLWDLSLKFYKSEELAARAIATLFQDTSPVRMHIQYIVRGKVTGNEHFARNLQLLSQVIDTIQMMIDFDRNDFQDLFIPRAITHELNRSIYHFYVPFYLSLELKKHVEPAYAFMAPLMMTLTYEFLSMANDYTYLYNDPAKLDPANANERYKINDIYAGYSGVSFGMKKLQTKKGFEAVGQAFGGSTKEGVKLLLK